MDAAWLQDFLQWVTAHPNLALGTVFLTGLLEALFLLGLLVPGAALLFAFGTLVAAGAMELWPTIIAAVAGAVIGDHLSYFLGFKLRNDIKQVWPLSRFPKAVQSGEEFFDKHGGKGIILGRFIGAVRPVIPTVAGAAGMRPLHFMVMDLLAMGPWIVAYMLPGVLFGASLNLAAEVGTRLFVLLLVVTVAVLFMVWFSRRLFLLVSNHTETLTHNILDWSQRHRRLGLLGPNLADPAQPETPGLAILAIILLVLSWIGFSLLWRAGDPHSPAELDAAIYNLFENLHTPWTDTLALAIAQFGTWQVYLPMALAVLGGLLAARRTMAAAHWCAALAFGAVLAIGLTVLLRIPAPVDYYRGNSSGYMSGHLIMSTVCYGFLAVLLATRKRQSKRWRYYGVAVIGIVLIALSRLYIGAQWFSDITLGIVVGVTWVSVLSLGYRRHLPQRVATISQMPLAMGVLLLAAGWQWHSALEVDRQHYRPSAELRQMSARQWFSSGFDELPAYRIDLAERRRYPLNLQWIGDIATIREQLISLGWQDRSDFEFKQSLLWLSKTRPIDELALLPQVHDGRPQTLAMLLPVDTERQWVLRLWHSAWLVEGQPLWLGSIAPYRIENLFDNLRVPWVEGDFNTGQALVRQQFDVSRVIQHPQAQTHPEGSQWDGQVLLLIGTSPTTP